MQLRLFFILMVSQLCVSQCLSCDGGEHYFDKFPTFLYFVFKLQTLNCYSCKYSLLI